MPTAGSLLQFRNKLAFPAGVAPGFDATHPASRFGNTGIFSWIPQGASGINLMSGSFGSNLSQAGALTATIDKIMGPTLGCNGTTQVISYSGYPAVVQTPLTMAAIAIQTGTQTDNFTHASAKAGFGAQFGTTGAGTVCFNTWNQTTTSSVLTLALNVPYFFLASWNGSVVIFLTLNLATGKIRTDSQTNTAINASDGLMTIGGANNGTFGWQGNIAAAMISGAYLSLSQVRMWAADPWAFWYPRTPIDWVGKVAAAAVFPFVRRNIIRASAKGFR